MLAFVKNCMQIKPGVNSESAVPAVEIGLACRSLNYERGRGQRETASGIVLLIGSILCFNVTPPAWSQATAQINGTVRDASGAVLPGVQITATQTDTGGARITTTDETGCYVVPSLLLGPYKVASLPGFRKFAQTGIVLQVGSSAVVNVKLEARTSGADGRSTGGHCDCRDAKRRCGEPLSKPSASWICHSTDVRRRILITLSGFGNPHRCASYLQHEHRGQHQRCPEEPAIASSTTLTALPIWTSIPASGMPLPFPEALQEFKLITSSQDASSGGHSAAVVNSVTKSGTDEFHGDMFWFMRNAAANGRDAFARKTTSSSAINSEALLAGRFSKTRHSSLPASRGQRHGRHLSQ